MYGFGLCININILECKFKQAKYVASDNAVLI